MPLGLDGDMKASVLRNTGSLEKLLTRRCPLQNEACTADRGRRAGDSPRGPQPSQPPPHSCLTPGFVLLKAPQLLQG